MPVQSLDQEDPLEEGMATPSSILAWRIPWREKPGGLHPTGLQKSQILPKDLSIVKVCSFIGSIAISSIFSNHLKEFRM